MSSVTTDKKKLLKRMESKKSHSWWWDSHISPKNNKWLAENLEEMDQSVKRMLKLIDEDGDSFAKKAEMYYKKRPELVALVEEFYRMYRALAERYDQVTGELRKSIPSDLHSQGSGISEVGSESASTFPSPDGKRRRPKSGHRAAGFEFFLGSGPNKEDDSTSSSSESESEGSSINYYSGSVVDGDDNELRRKIVDLESELHDVKQKLTVYQVDNMEGCNTDRKTDEPQLTQVELLPEKNVEAAFGSESDGQSHEPELRTTTPADGLRVARDRLQAIEMRNSEARREFDNIHSSDDMNYWENRLQLAQKDIDEWKSKFNSEYREVSKLQERIARYKSNLSEREQEIRELKTSMSNCEQKNSLEKLELQTKIAQLVKEQAHTEEKLKECKTCCQNLKDEIKQAENQKTELIILHGVKDKTQTIEIEHLRADMAGRDRVIDDLNRSLDLLLSEKDELHAKLGKLGAEVSTKGDQIVEMNRHLTMLHIEHLNLIAKAEGARVVAEKMKVRVTELESEVERLIKLVSDGAEEKREAIRQLCLSIEHYRDSYHMLREAFVGSKYKARLALVAA
uniref:NAB domain-containing protein n=1 Tax=Kalanchoe fedtschenkoi TaxID=63787 RepID=A0A7N0VJ74_KALFE